MTDVNTINGVAAASVATVNGVPCANITSIDAIDFSCGFSNSYSIKQTTSPYGGYVTIANPSTYHFESGGNDTAFSLSAWIKPNTAKNFWMFYKGKKQAGATAAAQEYAFGCHSSGVIQWVIWGNDAGSVYIQQYDGVDRSSVLADGNWHLLVATYSGNESQTGMSFHIDGAAAIDGGRSMGGSYVSMNDSGLPLWLGNIRAAEAPISQQPFLGYMDEMSVWAKKLSDGEVSEIWNSGVPTDLTEHSAASNLVSWWRMGDNNGGTGTAVTDVQGYGNGTLTGFQSADGFSSATVPGE